MATRIRILLPLLGVLGTALPLQAQTPGVHVPGFDQNDDFRFGISKEQVNSFWRETPDAERREGNVLQLDYDPWQFMNWTVMVHDAEGVIGFIATLQPSEGARRCRQVFQALVRGMNQELRVQPTGRVTVGERDDLCGAVAGRRGEAGYHWHVPSTGVSASVWVDPRDGLVHWVAGTSTMRQWAGPSRDPLAFAAGTERAPQVAAQPTTPQQAGTIRPRTDDVQQPPASAPRSDVRNAGVTERALKAIRPGMTYQDIVAIIGSEGRETSSSTSGGTTIAGYSWRDGMKSIIITFTNGRARISAQMGLDAAGPVTLAQFQRLREGMTQDEVIAILGGPGTYAGFTNMGEERYSEGYRWRGRSAGATASVSFVDGRVSYLFQIGLN